MNPPLKYAELSPKLFGSCSTANCSAKTEMATEQSGLVVINSPPSPPMWCGEGRVLVCAPQPLQKGDGLFTSPSWERSEFSILWGQPQVEPAETRLGAESAFPPHSPWAAGSWGAVGWGIGRWWDFIPAIRAHGWGGSWALSRELASGHSCVSLQHVGRT